MRRVLFLVLSLLSTTACAHNLEGQWTTECNPLGRHAIISTIDFDKNKFAALGSLYEQSGCGVETVKAKFKGSYDIGVPHGEGIEFNFAPETLTLTLLKPEVVTHYNKNRICDFDDWEMNAPKDILGQSNCVGFTPPEKTIEIYDIFNFKSKDDLKFSYFPLGMHVTDPKNRPLKIDPQSNRLWKVSEKSFRRVLRDLKIYDDYIAERRGEFTKIPGDINNKEWVKKKLALMVESDQYTRSYLDTPFDFNYSVEEKKKFEFEFSTRFEALDKSNTANMKMLVEKYDWFTISEFGKKADGEAWLLVQHADLDHDFQKEVLKILGKLWKVGETNSRNYAYLFDRVAASFSDPTKRVPQRYGTQGMCVGPSKWEPIEMEEPSKVNERRKEVGLEPIEDYIERFKDICK